MSMFTSVNAILAEYHHLHDLRRVEISVDKLRPIFENAGYVDRIIWEKFLFDTKYIAAQVKTYKGGMGIYSTVGDYARIQYAQNLNYCWQRFVICKEMCHCILDAPQGARISSTDNLLKLSEYLTDDLLDSIAGEGESFQPFETEKLAEVMAIETLFPMELRRSLCDPLDEGKVSHLQVALRYRIPEEYVHIGMSAGYFSAVLRGRGDDLVDIT